MSGPTYDFEGQAALITGAGSFAVLWLCSPGASFVVGVALPVDGGSIAA